MENTETITTIPSNMTFKNGRIYLCLNNKTYKIKDVRSSGELLRLELGKGVNIDIKIKRKEGSLPYGDSDAYHKYAFDRIEMPKRELRFVVENDIILDITSKRHNTYSIVELKKYIASKYKIVKIRNSFLKGILIFVREKNEVKYYVQIYPGNILTTQAMQVCACYRIYNLLISSYKHRYIKVKRMDVKREMEDTISKAIDDKIKELNENDMPKNKVPISEETAKLLLHHVLKSTSIRDSAIDETMVFFKNRPKDTYNLAIACAQTATIGKKLVKDNSKQKMATLANLILWIENIEELKQIMDN